MKPFPPSQSFQKLETKLSVFEQASRLLEPIQRSRLKFFGSHTDYLKSHGYTDGDDDMEIIQAAWGSFENAQAEFEKMRALSQKDEVLSYLLEQEKTANYHFLKNYLSALANYPGVTASKILAENLITLAKEAQAWGVDIKPYEKVLGATEKSCEGGRVLQEKLKLQVIREKILPKISEAISELDQGTKRYIETSNGPLGGDREISDLLRELKNCTESVETIINTH